MSNQASTIQSQLLNYLYYDVLLYFDEKTDLITLQQKEWQPLIDKFNAEFKLKLQATYSFELNYPKESFNVVASILDKLNLQQSSLLLLITKNLNSFILAYFVFKKELAVSLAYETSLLHLRYQQNLYGKDLAEEQSLEQYLQELRNITDSIIK